MGTGENEQGLRKIIDFTRLLSIGILIIHFYISCYSFFKNKGISSNITDRILFNISKLSIFNTPFSAKLFAFGFLLIYLFANKSRKRLNGNAFHLILSFFIGIFILFGSHPALKSLGFYTMLSYMVLTSFGYLLVLYSGSKLSGIVKSNLMDDIFNRENETFPQEERKLENEYSINLPANYRFKGHNCKSWINIINPFRGTLIMGTPGSGKSYFAIRHIITQHIDKGFSMFLYDFKYDDLSKIAYNSLLNKTGNKAKFFVINFDDLNKTHRCNPLDPENMLDIVDATEAARTIMLGLNKEWIKKQGDFFVESPINFLTAIIWYLKKHQNGLYCTLPHAIELMQQDYKQLFALLNEEPEIEVLINPFISAWKNEAFDQLEGQIASAKISLARLVSPSLYYVLSGNDFTLDLNNPKEPKVICLGNNPQKQQVYGAVLSLYISRMLKLVNQKDKLKSSLIFDEFPTIYLNNIDSLIATARSNKVATTLAIQDFSQLRKDYGKEQADVILNIVGNIISGQVSGDSAKFLAERFGKIKQKKQSITTNKADTSINDSTQLDFAIPVSKISSLSSGEFVGVVADDPTNKIDLKLFHNNIINNHNQLKKEEENYKEIPAIRCVNEEMVRQNYFQIKQDIQEILAHQFDLNPVKQDFNKEKEIVKEMDF
ncbi:conjugal transfer protein MobC [Pedobacter cryophilus]|uniref:Conjugal transfer protein TraG n=1 Tax=Pedobacter cryophilus TaxID=2571271 RepID=A0A4U1C0T9_9SPHI|nr:conjugal transfer protein MobC [Pedobacter cryophilus]TKB99152.1 conjugal transfer protein TraG [Pedobacter cryophilus]